MEPPILLLFLLSLATPGVEASEASKELFLEVWSSATLDCPLFDPGGIQQGGLVWLTPYKRVFKLGNDPHAESNCSLPEEVSTTLFVSDEGHVRLEPNGSLFIDQVGWGDRGRYECSVFGNSSDLLGGGVTYVNIDPGYREWVYHASLIYGAATAVGFLSITLLLKLVYYLLETYGCCLCCCCCKDQLPPKARKIKVALDSIEAYRAQQLEKLKDNYTQQTEWIRQNCAIQMERVRENYNGQVQNIKDFRQYGSTQIQAVREQYYEQMNRIRDYSTSQLDRVHENYIFQRQRLRKFSAQNYLRMRATGKYTQRTLNRVVGSLPPLYLDLSSCRQGMGDRQESIHFPDFRIDDLEAFDPAQLDASLRRSLFIRRHQDAITDEANSVYFTPESTPLREICAVDAGLPPRKTSSLKGTPIKETEAKMGVYARHKKSKSFSYFLPKIFNELPQAGSTSAAASGASAAPSAHKYRVRAIIEHASAGKNNGYLQVGAMAAEEVRDRVVPDRGESPTTGVVEGSSEKVSKVSTVSDEVSGITAGSVGSSRVALSSDEERSPLYQDCHGGKESRDASESDELLTVTMVKTDSNGYVVQESREQNGRAGTLLVNGSSVNERGGSIALVEQGEQVSPHRDGDDEEVM